MTAPLFVGLDNHPTYNENGSPVLLDDNATIIDADAPPTFDGATLILARNGGASANDVFSATEDRLADGSAAVVENDPGAGTILVTIGSYTLVDGVLTITFNSDATPARVDTLLRSLTYGNSNDGPPPTVIIDYTFDNGDQATGSITVSINPTNDPPSIDGLTVTSVYQPGSGNLVLSPGITLTDVDSTMLSGATVSITAGTGDDVLSANTGGTGISAIYSGGVLTLSGNTTLEQYRQVLATVAYSSSDPDPAANGQRALEWRITDSDASPLTSDPGTTLLDFSPTIDLDASSAGTGFSTGFSEGGAQVAVADSDAVMAAGTPPIQRLTVVLTNARPGDFLTVNGGLLDVQTDTTVAGQITLTITAGGGQFPTDTTLRSVSFGNANANVDPTTRDISFVVTDQNNASLAAHTTVIVSATNDPGIANDDTGATNENTTLVVGAAQGVLANDSDPDGLTVITGTVATAHGSIQFGSDGSYAYTPAAGFFGSDSVGYTAQDPFGNQVSAMLQLTVSAVNDPGSAQDDTAATAANTTLVVAAAQGVLANDSDPDGLSVITGTVATSQGGTIQFAADGSYTYTPTSFFAGSDSVGYTAQDSFGSQVSATLRINVSTAQGTGGADSFTPPSGNSSFDAGAGVDTVTFGFRLVDATITWSGNHVTIDGPSSHTVLSGFERYVFTDGTVDNNDGNPLVDDLFYFARNHDVWNAHTDADQHYNTFGWHENRDPATFFSTLTYLSANPDVKAAGANPLTHFDTFGWHEGRVPSINFDPAQYLAANPDVAAANADPLLHFLISGAAEGRQPFAPAALSGPTGFDYAFYLAHNPDVAAAGVDPLLHFQIFGWKEGRDPNALFNTTAYLATYADVAAAGVNPLDHFDAFGWKEGRDPSVDFDTPSYLAAYPDVAAAGVNPLAHFLQFGIHEGRSPFADGVWG